MKELKDILKIIRVKKISILVIVVISIILGSIYSFKCTMPQYKSTATIILGTVSSIDNPNSNFIEYNSTSRETLMATYNELSNSSAIMNEVSEKINKSVNVEELIKAVEISQIGKTDMIKITATNVNSIVARDVVKEVINVLDKHIKEIYKIEKNYIVDEPTVSKIPYNIHHTLDIAISAIIGIIISIIYATIIYNKQRLKNEIEINSNKKELIKVKINEKICLFIKDKCMNFKKMIFTLFEKKEKILDEEQEREKEIIAEEKEKMEEEARKAKEEKAQKLEIEKKKAEEKEKRNKEKQERNAIKKEEWNKKVSDFKLKSEEKKAKFLEKCSVKKEKILEDFKIQKEKYNEYKIKKSEEKRIASEEKAKKAAMMAEEKAIRNAELVKIREEERIKKEEEKLQREEEKRLANEEKAKQAAIIAEERAKKAAIIAEEKAKKEAELAKIREEEKIRKEEEKAKKEAEAKFTDEYLEENLYPKTKYSKF